MYVRDMLKSALMYAIEVQVKELMDAKERISTLEDLLELKEHTIRGLQHKLSQFEVEGKGAVMPKSTSITTSVAYQDVISSSPLESLTTCT